MLPTPPRPRARRSPTTATTAPLLPPASADRALVAAPRTKRLRIERRAPAPRRAHGGDASRGSAFGVRGAPRRRAAAVLESRWPRHVRAASGSSSRGSSSSARSHCSRYGARLGGTETPDDLAYRWSSSVAALVQYGLMLGILLLIARGLPKREAVRTSPPRVVEARARARRARARHDLPRRVRLRAGALALRQLEPVRRAGSRPRRLGLEPRSGIRRILPRRDARRAGGRGAHVPRARDLAARCRGAPCSRSCATGLLFGAAHGLLVALPILAFFGIVVGVAPRPDEQRLPGDARCTERSTAIALIAVRQRAR